MAGRREQKRAQIRRTILAAARRVFARQSFRDVTVRDVIRESGLAVGTFYNYFPDKNAVFLAVVEELFEDLRPALVEARAQATSPVEFVGDAFSALVRVIAGDPERRAIIRLSPGAMRGFAVGSVGAKGLLEELEADLQQAIDAGLVPAHRADMMATAMVGAAIDISTRFAGRGEDEEIGAFLTTTFLGGIASWR
jgi:AcrR family transcriptional regulator